MPALWFIITIGTLIVLSVVLIIVKENHYGWLGLTFVAGASAGYTFVYTPYLGVSIMCILSAIASGWMYSNGKQIKG